MREYIRNVAVSFRYEHGIFLKEGDRKMMKAEVGEPILESPPKEDVYGYEVCKDFSDIDPEEEAKALLAIFEDITDNHFMFLVKHGIIKALHPSKQVDPLIELYPELDVRPDCAFAYLYRELEKTLIDLNVASASPAQSSRKIRKRLKDEIQSSLKAIMNTFEDYYEKADCVIGIGALLSNMLGSKPLDLSFGIGELDSGVYSVVSGEPAVANPFFLKWIMDDFCENKQNKVRWKLTDYVISKATETPVIPIKTLTIKTYLPSQELLREGVTTEIIARDMKTNLAEFKPFLFNSDILMPFTCPSIVLSVEGTEEQKREQTSRITYYGFIPQEADVIYKIDPLTTLDIRLFDFPLFNKKFPVVLDTSAIDISRFPLSRTGSFFEAYLENRALIIPTAAIHELKTRLRGQDGIKVQKALARLNNMLAWGLLKDIRVEGEFPELSSTTKRDIEDLRDCMVLDTAKRQNGILFTNDRDLIKFAAMIGVYAITFSGLEEDVLAVIKESNLKLSPSQAVHKIQEFGEQERLEQYAQEDIKWMIDDLCRQNKLCLQKLRGKQVLQHLGSRREVAPSSG
jgi:rRNA-processing protein FCF1